MSVHSEQQQEQNYGVLLYYKYSSIADLDQLLSFYQSNCTSLSLLGRVRLAPHGVNVTVGGQLSSLKKHVGAVKSMPLFEGTDFKLASCNQPLNDKVAKECGFTSLSIRIVEELVTFSSHPLLNSPKISNAGTHLSAVEFHSVLQEAVKLSEDQSLRESQGIVLLDARNLYETRIGKFQTPGVETLDPETRQYSDLHAWIDNNSEHLKGKQILMYCTGGIRCEMASAYIKGKGVGFENVYQLYGGIQRYLEQFPSGGFFKGKNFVFDHRISVGSSDSDVMGCCLICNCPFDDYSSRCRCTYCRMLVLGCNSCQVKGEDYICELCRKHGKSIPSDSIIEYADSGVLLHQIDQSAHQLPNRDVHAIVSGCTRKLRILCLHGFRQNASSFKGRTASLAKKLKNLAELVFVDAPHELPFIYQPSAGKHCESETSIEQRSPKVNCNKKFAWLVNPDFGGGCEADWKVADGPFDPFQYQHQTGGLDVSMAYLKSVFLRDGPFDGILGFSQGAAMAALVCAKRDELKSEMSFRFAILCSGFAVRLQEFVQTPINCPSLHIFGHDHGRDRQISNEVSKNLATYFEDGSSMVIQHDSGHIIPTRPPYIDEIKDFLKRFL